MTSDESFAFLCFPALAAGAMTLHRNAKRTATAPAANAASTALEERNLLKQPRRPPARRDGREVFMVFCIQPVRRAKVAPVGGVLVVCFQPANREIGLSGLGRCSPRGAEAVERPNVVYLSPVARNFKLASKLCYPPRVFIVSQICYSFRQ